MAAAVLVTAAHGSAQKSVEGRPGADGEQAQNLLFAGSTATAKPGANDEELYISGKRCGSQGTPHCAARGLAACRQPPPARQQAPQADAVYVPCFCAPLFLCRVSCWSPHAWHDLLHQHATPMRSVVWTAGGVVRKQLTAQAPVMRAAWCFFQNTGPEPILCLLHPGGALSVFTHDGDSHVIPLPGSFTGLWPLPQGVLLTVRCGGCGGRGQPFAGLAGWLWVGGTCWLCGPTARACAGVPGCCS